MALQVGQALLSNCMHIAKDSDTNLTSAKRVEIALLLALLPLGSITLCCNTRRQLSENNSIQLCFVQLHAYDK